MLNKEVCKFFDLLDSVGNCYDWVTIAFVAVRKSPGEHWIILHGGLSFEPIATDFQGVKQRYETKHILAVRISINAFTPNQIKNLIIESSIAVDSDTAVLAVDQHGPSYFLTDSLSFEGVAGLRTPTLLIRGKSTQQVFQDIELNQQELIWELKSSDQPFDSLEELLFTVGLVTAIRADVTTLTVFAQSPVLITNSYSFESGKANILAICATKANIDELKFGYRFFSNQIWHRGVVEKGTIAWRPGEKSRPTECSFNVAAEDASSIQIFASYRGTAWHQWWVFDPKHLPNIRHTVFSTIDLDLTRLHSLLNPQKSRDAEDFERGIHILFYLLGFVTCYTGKTPGLTEGPDLIAHTGQGHCLVIENTVSTLNNNSKLAKLIGRTNQVRQRLTEAKSGHLRVCPVIITALSRADIVGELDVAGQNRIAVLCAEEVTELYTNLSFSVAGSDELFEKISSYIPEKNHSDGIG